MLEMPAMLDILQGKLYTLSGGVERVSLGCHGFEKDGDQVHPNLMVSSYVLEIILKMHCVMFALLRFILTLCHG